MHTAILCYDALDITNLAPGYNGPVSKEKESLEFEPLKTNCIIGKHALKPANNPFKHMPRRARI